MYLRNIVYYSLATGTVAALAMIPFGFAFRAMGLRIGHYGPKFASLFLDDPGPPELFLQHIVLGWLSAVPLVAFLISWRGKNEPLLIGAVYGAAYYVLINSFALPLYFGDQLPWLLGIKTIAPSFITHIVFGMVIGYLCRKLVGSYNPA
jgi:uncharacterized membrane protein YeaQ/YmgE (transglycosylase-associated protein family)